ncbi:MAG: hypothetical protein WCH38_03670 [Actinomycetota bacterium]
MRRLVLVISLIVAGLIGIAQPAQAATTCRESGEGCVVGMIGPGGGVVFYDAGSQQWWGRFLEARMEPKAFGSNWGPRESLYIDGQDGLSAAMLRLRSMQIGMGAKNTQLMLEKFGAASIAGKIQSGWSIPSVDELDALYNYWKLGGAGRFYRGVIWSSSEQSATFAWYQQFQDGTKFTDANGIIRGLSGNKDLVMSPYHQGSFASQKFGVVSVRAFPAGAGTPPRPVVVSSVRQNAQCSAGVSCAVGDIGPGGGVVFYDAGSTQSWGRYLEAAPASCEIAGVPFKPVGGVQGIHALQIDRVRAKAIGMGRANTDLIVQKYGATRSHAAALVRSQACNGLTDWFLPSSGELNLAWRVLAQNRVNREPTPGGGFDIGYYWTSSDYNGTEAWTQYFNDGQQFDRVQTLSANKQAPYRTFKVRGVRAFG